MDNSILPSLYRLRKSPYRLLGKNLSSITTPKVEKKSCPFWEPNPAVSACNHSPTEPSRPISLYSARYARLNELECRLTKLFTYQPVSITITLLFQAYFNCTYNHIDDIWPPERVGVDER
jgi:hypothetical protein